MPDPQPPICPSKQSQQSPVNLTNPFVTDFGTNGLDIRWDKGAKGHLMSGDEGVKITFGFDSRMSVKLDRQQFFLTQFHFHHPSEHAINGKQHSVELHAVHQNLNDGRLVVVGIFIEPGNRQSVFPPLVAALPALLKDGKAKGERLPVSLNPLEYLPDDTKHYYFYQGSLTTPPYSENVTWAVLREPKRIPKEQLATLIEHVQHPARIPQPLNRRFILANFER